MNQRRHFTDPASGRIVSGGYLIESLMSAPGWRVRTCDFENGKPIVSEVPVIGWAVITQDCSATKENTFISRHATLMCAQIMDDGFPYNQTVEQLRNYGETGVRCFLSDADSGDEGLIEQTREDLEAFLELSSEDDEWARERYQSVQNMCADDSHVVPFTGWRRRYIDILRGKLGLKEVPAVA